MEIFRGSDMRIEGDGEAKERPKKELAKINFLRIYKPIFELSGKYEFFVYFFFIVYCSELPNPD